jgi:hypothetical protein
MKISSFYLNDISEYEDISNYIHTQIIDRYYGVGVNSISISRFISLIKKILKTYVKLKYQKNITLIVTLPKIDETIVTNDDVNNNVVKLRLSYDIVSRILDGRYDDLFSFISDIIHQLNTELTSNNRFSFVNYLEVQMEMLSDISITELKIIYQNEDLKGMIPKKDCWIKLSQQSSIFKDYYTIYMDNSSNKSLFYSFIRLLLKKI